MTAIWAPAGNAAGAGPQAGWAADACFAVWALRVTAHNSRAADSGMVRMACSRKGWCAQNDGGNGTDCLGVQQVRHSYRPRPEVDHVIVLPAPELRLLLSRGPSLRNRGT